ncbi:unnamed protein product [Schistosoma curassoni]|uniref:Phage protein n=1 Tax=Schistosoma curassoni TaxID=6186 RepID=A0A183JNJ2_9TREM|nr:unnamed protein product [Schistosoma curassoni]
MENIWKGSKEALTFMWQEFLVLNKHHLYEQISMETMKKAQKWKNKMTGVKNNRTRTEKVKEQSEYTEAYKQMKKSTRADMQKYMEEPSKTAEKAAREVNVRQTYVTTRKLADKYNKSERPVKDNEDKAIIKIHRQSNGWVEQFEELLN